MKMRVEDGGACRKVVHISVSVDETRGEYDSIVASFARTGKVPGFRPGRAPANVVERHYRHGISEEIKKQLAPRCYREALKEKGIAPVAIVDVKDMSFARDTGLTFSVTVDVAPDFKLPKYKKISVKPGKIDVQDKEVEDTLQRLLLSKAKFETVNRPCMLGDLVCVDYAGTVEGAPVRNIVPDMPGLDQGANFWALLGEPEFLPGFPAAVAGTSVDEKKDIAIMFPQDYRVKELAGKKAAYAVTLKEIKGKSLPPMNKDLLDQFGVDSESALKQKIRDELKKMSEAKDRDRMRTEIVKALVGGVKFDLPQSVIEEEKHLTVRSILRRAAMSGMSRKQVEGQMADIRKIADETSLERVKLNYILARIADEEKVEVDEKAVDAQVERLADSYRMSPEELRKELEKGNAMERLVFDIRCDKTMDALLEMAKPKE